ncbi:redoxin domain-containing protein [Flagellimonas sp.]|uniref:redoxin domain-containing protein n=1 Tax=Flagellimonas sp. TaxID=2058762 RepID=UPI003F49ED40
MRKIVPIVLLIAFIASCSSKPEGFVINAKISGDLENGTRVFLKTTDSLNKLQDVDTTTVENGIFSFTGEQENPKLYYIFLESNKGNIPLFLENGDIDIKFQKDSLNYAQLKGTQQNELFMKFLDESRKIGERVRSMQRDMNNAARAQDTATVTSLREEYLELQEHSRSFNIEFAKENPNALISALILGNLLYSKILPNEEIQQIYDALTPEIKASEPGKDLKEQLDKLQNTDIGSVAPEFSAPTPQGNMLALSDIKGKVTLVDFWAAWCRPCRAENPNIVSVYKKYHDKGLNVVGVSLDTRADDWNKAIEADGLEWNHISNLKRFQDPIAQLYNINAIPAAFLLDENGIIVAKNLRGAALEQKVAELLN